MAQEEVALKIALDAAAAATSVKDLKRSIIDLKNGALEAAAAGNQSLAAAYTKGAAEAKDKINDLNKAINQLGDTGSKLAAIGKIGATIAGGFAAAQGAAALFGASAEDVQRQLLKVQAAMAIVQGFQGFADGIKVVNVFSNQIGAAGQATKLFGAIAAESEAIATAGVTLLIAAVVTLIANFDTVKNSIANAFNGDDTLVAIQRYKLIAEKTKALRDDHDYLKQKLEDIAQENSHIIPHLENQAKIMKAQGASAGDIYATEAKILDIKIAQEKQNLTLLEAQAEMNKQSSFLYQIEVDRAKLTGAKVPEMLGKDDEKIKAQKDKIEALTTDKTILDINYTKGAVERNDSMSEKIIQSFRSQYEEKKAQLNKQFVDSIKAGDDTIEAAKLYANELKKIDEEQAQSKEKTAENNFNFERELMNRILKAQDDANVISAESSDEKYAAQRKQIEDNATIELQVATLTEEEKDAIHAKEIASLNALDKARLKEQYDNIDALDQMNIDQAKGIDELAEAQKQQLTDKLAFDLQQTGLSLQMRLKLEADYAKKIQELDRKAESDKWNNRIKNAQTFTNALANLSDLSMNIQLAKAHGNAAKEEEIKKQAFENSKKFQIAQAILNGIAAVPGIISGNASLGPFAPIADALEIAAVAISTADSISKIKATQYQSASAPSLNAPSGGSLPDTSQGVPINNPVQQSTILNQTQNPTTQPIVKAVVVESDITKSQSTVRNIQDRAEIH